MDFQTWERREIFEHFYNVVPCTYSLTCEIDVKNLLRKNKKGFNVALLYCISRVLNRFENFKMHYENQALQIFETLNPSFTLLNRNKTGFMNLYFEYSEDFLVFQERYLQTLKRYKDSLSLMPQKEIPNNVFMFSSLPWIKFSSFNLNLDKGSKYLLPILTAGRFEEKEDKVLLPLCIQVHHSVCDGYHLALFFKGLEEEICNF